MIYRCLSLLLRWLLALVWPSIEAVMCGLGCKLWHVVQSKYGCLVGPLRNLLNHRLPELVEMLLRHRRSRGRLRIERVVYLRRLLHRLTIEVLLALLRDLPQRCR